jgi:hypothetical protein
MVWLAIHLFAKCGKKTNRSKFYDFFIDDLDGGFTFLLLFGP